MTTPTESAADTDIEDVESFRLRARAWIADNLPLLTGEEHYGLHHLMSDEEELARIGEQRALQRQLFDAGFAGIAVPRAYGGQGLTAAHQRAFNEEISGHAWPMRLQVPTFSPCIAVILEFGTHEQKLRHVPAALRGDEIWIQFLSEPSGGSDVAGALTTAVRDGDEWILNGSKVWSSGAWWSDWALCLARTNWDVPKHRGLSVFMLPITAPGVEIQRIEMLSGVKEFCQEFLTEVRVPDSDRIGEVDQGWTVGSWWMMEERLSFSSPLVTAPADFGRTARETVSPAEMAVALGRADDARAVDLVGESRVLDLASARLNQRIGQGLATGTMHPQSSAIGRLSSGMTATRLTALRFELADGAAGAWADDDVTGNAGTGFLVSQSACIGGGTTEIARNVIAERVLGMPREPAPDRDTAFREVAKNSQRRG